MKLLVLICTAGLVFMASMSGAEPANIVGSLSLPRQWQVFGPLDQTDPVASPDVLKTIPSEINISGHKLKPRTVNVDDPFNRLDLAPLIGGTKEGKTAYVFIPFTSSSDMEATLGMGADWWLQAWLDGNLIMDTTKDGNGPWSPTVQDHQATVRINKGAHVLVVRFISGSGSSILALGGPDDLRKGRPPYPLFQNEPMPAGNLVTNGGFESGPSGDSFIPSGWENGKGLACFQKTELIARTNAPISGSRSLEINTLASGAVKRKLYVPLSVDIGTCYEVSFKAYAQEGNGYASVSVRDNIDSGFNTSFIRAIGADNTDKAIKKGQLGACKAYYFFDTPSPCLVIETHGPVHAVLDDLCIIPVPQVNMWRTFNEQRAPWKSDWNALSEAIVTPHTSWAKPYAGGMLKVLSLMPRIRQRLTVELAQRLSMQYTPIIFETTGTPWSPSELGRDYWTYDTDGDPQLFLKEADAFKKLTQPTDCIVIAELNPSAVSPAMTEAILKQVEAGSGLIITGSRWHRPDLAKFKEGAWAKALNDNTVTREQTDFVQVGGASQNTSPGQRINEPYKSDLLGFYRYGQGRIMIWSGHTTDDNRADFEADMSHIIKAMLWASRKLPPVRLESIRVPGTTNGVLNVQVKAETLPLGFNVTVSAPISGEFHLNAWIDDYQGKEPLQLGAPAWATGRQEAALELPTLPAGTHRLHLQLKRGNQVEDWTTVILDVTSKYGITAITCDDKKPYFAEDDTVTGSVQLTAPLASDQTLRMELRDADGRLWQTKTLRGEGSKIDFAFTMHPSLVLLQQLRAHLIGPQGTLAESAVEFAVVHRPEWYASHFDFQLWCVPDNSLLVCKELRKQGVTSTINNDASRNKTLNNMRTELSVGIAWEQENKPGVYFPGHATKIVGDKAHAPVRYPCLNALDFREQLVQKVASDMKTVKKWAPLAYGLAHEWNYRSYGSLMGRVDTCFCTNCLESFRQFTRAEYGSMTKLNTAWGTDFKDWQEVAPVVLADALKTNQIPRWIDHRRHADRVFADYFKFKMEAVRSIDPSAQGAIDNVRVGLADLDSYSGVDYWLLFHDAKLAGAGLPAPYLLSFTPPESERRHLVMYRGAFWHPHTVTGDENLLRLRFGNQPWKGLLQGFHGYAYYADYFFGPPNSPYNPVLNADLTGSDISRVASASVAQIRSGIARFIFESSRKDSSIAILYSRSSEHAATAWQTLHHTNSLAAKISPPGQIGFYTAVLNALGYQFKALSEDQVTNHALATGGFRLLILPFAQAISTGAVDQIREFVKGGGCLLADVRPGMGDQHGSPGTAGYLDDVFDVQHQTAYTAYEPSEDAISVTGMIGKTDLTCAYPRVLCGPAVKVTGASAQGKCQRSNIPAFLVNRFGQGQAILLNFVLPELDDHALQMMSALLAATDLKPLFRIEAPAGRSPLPSTFTEAKKAPADAEGLMTGSMTGPARPELVDFVNGQIHCFGFWYAARRGLGAERLRITPPVAGHIYDLKTNKYLGRQERFEVSLPLEDTGVYASVPYKIQRPSLALTQATSPAGLSMISCLAQLHPDETANEKHVVKFSIFAPDGAEWTDFAATETANNSQAEHVFVLPLNAPKGKWKVSTREAISGLSDSASVRVK